MSCAGPATAAQRMTHLCTIHATHASARATTSFGQKDRIIGANSQSSDCIAGQPCRCRHAGRKKLPPAGKARGTATAAAICKLLLRWHTRVAIPPMNTTHTPAPRPHTSRIAHGCAAAILALTGMTAHAHQPVAAVEHTVRSFLASETAGLPGEVQVETGSLDPNNRLTPCQHLEAFLPAGTRAWGQINVGVRCTAPQNWTVYVPARVAVYLDYLVTTRAIRPGQAIGPQDVRLEYGDLTAQPDNAITELALVTGQQARVAIASGQTLRQDMLRLPPAVLQGQLVKVVAQGSGFTVMNEGRAMNRAAEGETVRVRMNNGQVVSGTARQGGIVEVRF